MALLFRLCSVNHVTTIGSNAQNTILGHFVSGICWCVVYWMPLADTSNKMTKDSILCVTSIGSNMLERMPDLGVVGWIPTRWVLWTWTYFMHLFVTEHRTYINCGLVRVNMYLVKSGSPLRAPGDQLRLLDSMGSTGCSSWPLTWCCHFLCPLREPCFCLRRPLRSVWLNMRQQWMSRPWCPPGILLHVNAKTKGKVGSTEQG